MRENPPDSGSSQKSFAEQLTDVASSIDVELVDSFFVSGD